MSVGHAQAIGARLAVVRHRHLILAAEQLARRLSLRARLQLRLAYPVLRQQTLEHLIAALRRQVVLQIPQRRHLRRQRPQLTQRDARHLRRRIEQQQIVAEHLALKLLLLHVHRQVHNVQRNARQRQRQRVQTLLQRLRPHVQTAHARIQQHAIHLHPSRLRQPRPQLNQILQRNLRNRAERLAVAQQQTCLPVAATRRRKRLRQTVHPNRPIHLRLAYRLMHHRPRRHLPRQPASRLLNPRQQRLVQLLPTHLTALRRQRRKRRIVQIPARQTLPRIRHVLHQTLLDQTAPLTVTLPRHRPQAIHPAEQRILQHLAPIRLQRRLLTRQTLPQPRKRLLLQQLRIQQRRTHRHPERKRTRRLAHHHHRLPRRRMVLRPRTHTLHMQLHRHLPDAMHLLRHLLAPLAVVEVAAQHRRLVRLQRLRIVVVRHQHRIHAPQLQHARRLRQMERERCHVRHVRLMHRRRHTDAVPLVLGARQPQRQQLRPRRLLHLPVELEAVALRHLVLEGDVHRAALLHRLPDPLVQLHHPRLRMRRRHLHRQNRIRTPRLRLRHHERTQSARAQTPPRQLAVRRVEPAIHQRRLTRRQRNLRRRLQRLTTQHQRRQQP